MELTTPSRQRALHPGRRNGPNMRCPNVASRALHHRQGCQICLTTTGRTPFHRREATRGEPEQEKRGSRHHRPTTTRRRDSTTATTTNHHRLPRIRPGRRAPLLPPRAAAAGCTCPVPLNRCRTATTPPSHARSAPPPHRPDHERRAKASPPPSLQAPRVEPGR
jgi:hypothetical protein